MRIAFVGKGGAGKTTSAALFAAYARTRGVPVLAVDADINMHLGPLLGLPEAPAASHISHPEAAASLKTHLKGDNERIASLGAFRKTTPPTRDSRFVVLGDEADPLLARFAAGAPGFRLLTVGTYEEERIGASCYHNNLSVLENLLTHLVDAPGVLVCDMVAGTDAFASTLHAQFDVLALVVEPTRRGLEVYGQYAALAAAAGVADRLAVIGNKVRGGEDEAFLRAAIPAARFLGVMGDAAELRRLDREGGAVDLARMEPEHVGWLPALFARLAARPADPDERYRQLLALHRTYVAQASIIERFGDLTTQIDPGFDYAGHLSRLWPIRAT